MRQRETLFKERVRRRLDTVPQSHWIKIQMVATRGVPDFLGVVRGRFVALELKTEGGRATKLQAHWLEKLNAAGAFTKIVRPSNLDETINELLSL